MLIKTIHHDTLAGYVANEHIDMSSVSKFRVHQTSGQTIARGVFTKINWHAEDFDVAGDFDLANDKFLPTVAGYYQINLNVVMSGLPDQAQVITCIYKNGTCIASGRTSGTEATPHFGGTAATIVYLNGSTDYIEGYVYFGYGAAGSHDTSYGGGATEMSGHRLS